MCIAILKTKDGNITDEQLLNCFDNNPDGAGIAYTKDNKIFIVKGIFDAKQFVEEYHKAVAEADGAMLVHCRIGTSGFKDYTNCHPHVVSDECVMIHNGILSIDVPKDSKVSDTVLYVEQYLKPLPKDFMLNDGIMSLITDHIGAGNKFVFLNNRGDFSIANEKAGHWKNGVWFSNYSYEAYSFYTKGYKGKSKAYSPYTSYWDEDDYEWESEAFELTPEEEWQLQVAVDSMTDDEVLLLGATPTYDFYKQSLKRINQYKGSVSKVLLDEIAPDIASELEDRYYTILDSLSYDVLADDVNITDPNIMTLVDEAKKSEADGVYVSEALEDYMDATYEDYEFDVAIRYDEIVYENPDLSYEANTVADVEDDTDDVTEDNVVDVDYSSDRLNKTPMNVNYDEVKNVSPFSKTK